MAAGYVPISSGEPQPLGAAYVPILLSEVEQEQRPSRNGDREAIVVGAGLCDGKGERAYTGYAPHTIRNVSANVFSLRRFGNFFAETSAAMFLLKRLLPKRPESNQSTLVVYWHQLSLDNNTVFSLSLYISANASQPWNEYRVYYWSYCFST